MKAGIPVSGSYPVVLSRNAISAIFSPLVHHCSAASQYRKTSGFSPGSSIYPDGQCLGEPLTIISNGFMPFGLKTLPSDIDGVPASRFEMIREGVFEKPWSTSQYADYLGIEPTGTIANLEIPIGPGTRKDLLNSGERVLEVVEFSAMMPDVVSGNFAAEIKLGYEHRDGKVRPVRGGSVSGNFISGFNHAYFSTEAQSCNYALTLENFGTYTGPELIRFETFQVGGD